MRLIAEQAPERVAQLSRFPGAAIERDRVKSQPALRVGEHGPDHLLGSRIHAVQTLLAYFGFRRRG